LGVGPATDPGVFADEALDDSSARQIVLDALQSDLLAEAQDRITRQRSSPFS